MSSSHTFSTPALILKRHDVGEYDRVVTVFTRDHGKLKGIAKGSRRLTSSRLASFEPGNIVELFCAQSHTFPIITQTKLLYSGNGQTFSGGSQIRLTQLKQLSQILEMVDALFAEGQAEEQLFEVVVGLVHDVWSGSQEKVQKSSKGGLQNREQHQLLNEPNKVSQRFSTIQSKLQFLLTQLGYQNPAQLGYSSLLEYVSMLAEKPLRSFEYLTVKKT